MREPGGSSVSAGLRLYLKSLSLEVIFSSRLEMWYEALAMSVLAVSLLLADCARGVCSGCGLTGCCVSGWLLQPPASLGFSEVKRVVLVLVLVLVLLLPPCLPLQRLSHPGARSLVCLNGAPVLSAEGRG